MNKQPLSRWMKKNYDFEDDNLQIQTFHRTYTHVKNNDWLALALIHKFPNTNLISRTFLLLDTSFWNEIKLKCQRRDSVLKFVTKCNNESSHPVTKTPNKTASPISLEIWISFPNLYLVEHTGLIKLRNQLLINNDKLPQYTDDYLSSQDSRIGLSLTLFYSLFDKVHAALNIAQYKFYQCQFFHSCKYGHHFSAMTVLIAK